MKWELKPAALWYGIPRNRRERVPHAKFIYIMELPPFFLFLVLKFAVLSAKNRNTDLLESYTNVMKYLYPYNRQNNNAIFCLCVYSKERICPLKDTPINHPDQTQVAGSGRFLCKMWERARAETVHAGRGNGLFATDHAPVGAPVTICNSLHNQSSLT